MFYFDCETHIWPPMDDIAYYPNFKKYVIGMVSLGGTALRRMQHSQPSSSGVETRGSSQTQADAQALIASMDDAGVQMACVLPETMRDLSHGARVRSTNGYVAKEISKYPKRLVGICNVGPIISRGVKDAVWELEYLVKEMNFKGCKFYPPDDAAINDRNLWPFYAKVQELKIPLFVHTGFSWVWPGKSAYCYPVLLEDVFADFPDIVIVAYHLGYPYSSELNMLAAKTPNLYIGTSLLPSLGLISPGLAKRLLGDAILWAGIDRLIWGTDWSGRMVSHKDNVDYLTNFSFSPELQSDYGYPALTEDDKKKWAGLNLARIMGISPDQNK